MAHFISDASFEQTEIKRAVIGANWKWLKEESIRSDGLPKSLGGIAPISFDDHPLSFLGAESFQQLSSLFTIDVSCCGKHPQRMAMCIYDYVLCDPLALVSVGDPLASKG